MKELLVQTARRTGLVDAEQLTRFLDENKVAGKVDFEIPFIHCINNGSILFLRLFAFHKKLCVGNGAGDLSPNPFGESQIYFCISVWLGRSKMKGPDHLIFCS